VRQTLIRQSHAPYGEEEQLLYEGAVGPVIRRSNRTSPSHPRESDERTTTNSFSNGAATGRRWTQSGHGGGSINWDLKKEQSLRSRSGTIRLGEFGEALRFSGATMFAFTFSKVVFYGATDTFLSG
jgi:hypothetical protein